MISVGQRPTDNFVDLFLCEFGFALESFPVALVGATLYQDEQQ